uniref:Claudin n=1 Tax=Scleropages formosus TaxID=113540 RepID=A0A8C9QX22_SCLFO
LGILKENFLGFFLSLLGLLGMVIATLIPHWRRRAYGGSNIVTATGYIKGLWMECVWHSTGVYQCQFHRSLLALPMDLQAARALMVISCVLSVMATGVATVGMECTRICEGSRNKSTLSVAAGVAFILAGLLCLLTVAWTTDSVVRDFRNPVLPSTLKYEIGPAVFLGFVSSVLSIIAGGVFCLFCEDSQLRRPYTTRRATAVRPMPPPYELNGASNRNYAPSHLSASSSGYRIGDYV